VWQQNQQIGHPEGVEARSFYFEVVESRPGAARHVRGDEVGELAGHNAEQCPTNKPRHVPQPAEAPAQPQPKADLPQGEDQEQCLDGDAHGGRASKHRNHRARPRRNGPQAGREHVEKNQDPTDSDEVGDRRGPRGWPENLAGIKNL